MWQRIPKKNDKNSNYNLSGSTSRNYTWVELSARFGTVKLKVSRRSLYIQIRLKLNHEDFHTQTLNVWYLYLQFVILLAKPPLVFPWSPKTTEWFSAKTIVLVRVYKQQFQGTVLWMVFEIQGIKNSGLLDADASNQDESRSTLSYRHRTKQAIFQKTQDAILGILESFRRIPRKIKISTMLLREEGHSNMFLMQYQPQKKKRINARQSHTIFLVWAGFCILLMLGNLILWLRWSAESLELVQTYERNYPNSINWFTHKKNNI